MGMKAARTAMGSVMMGTRADRKWKRKKMQTKLTIIASMIRSRVSVCMDWLISQERSQAVTISTPGGREGHSLRTIERPVIEQPAPLSAMFVSSHLILSATSVKEAQGAMCHPSMTFPLRGAPGRRSGKAPHLVTDLIACLLLRLMVRSSWRGQKSAGSSRWNRHR